MLYISVRLKTRSLQQLKEEEYRVTFFLKTTLFFKANQLVITYINPSSDLDLVNSLYCRTGDLYVKVGGKCFHQTNETFDFIATKCLAIRFSN